MRVEVRVYGGLKERVSTSRFTVELPEGATVAELMREIGGQIAGLTPRALRGVAVAQGDEILPPSAAVKPGFEVSLLPPVSGGAGRPPRGSCLSEDPLDLGSLLAETADSSCGGLVVFSGDVRDHNAGRQDVVAMEYEAHVEMAEKVLAAIEAEVLARFEVRRCRIQHRLGRVELGQSSVIVVCRAAHRGAAFEGARYGIDELKARAPIWKREFYSDGTAVYLDGVPLAPGAEEGG